MGCSDALLGLLKDLTENKADIQPGSLWTDDDYIFPKTIVAQRVAAVEFYPPFQSGVVYVGPDPPPTPQNGWLWWRNNPDGNLYVWYDDGDSQQWVAATATAASASAPAQYWTLNGNLLEPQDATKLLALPGNPTAAAATLLTGARAPKGRLQTGNTGNLWIGLSINDDLTGVRDDATKPAWWLTLDATEDTYSLWHQAVGGGATRVQRVDGAGNLFTYGPALFFGSVTPNLFCSLAMASTTKPILDVAANPGQQIGTTPSWYMRLNADTPAPTGDHAGFMRMPPGTPTAAYMLQVNALGDLTLAAPGTSTKSRLCLDAVGGTNLAGNLSLGLGTQDDATKPSWLLTLGGAGSDFVTIARAPAGSTLVVPLLKLDANGNLITKGTITPSGTPSDARLKKDIRPYVCGLSEILSLHPIRYRWNGLAGLPDDGTDHYGFDAFAVYDVMPEMVSTMRTKLQSGDASDTDLLTLDLTCLPLALVNAVKELYERVSILEQKGRL